MSIEIAQTIQKQLFATGKIKVMSWGANSWTAGENFLMFKVQGFKFKGIVKITLKSNDTYTIEFLRTRSREVVHTVEGAYWDNMNEIIDNYVEYTGADYDERVKNALHKF